ncbi:unnamed protein product (macronuclear) [Paramecium tetraurelia]|uniref:Uncharacterized protein n=1 Tax=Paramecium tetraurelia TaxID=5888 RepID=A0DU08_PARTE|nr:uncharacterized protein GSPATT00020209001 [Paramecium tetraurelia]CAK86525.1 unnamed protein product [Paramecium tetraurelia]|eukprot:XP_001453922.1 hypothetical protein (macronuclear) [Paramecium tetraurelia strain d4-2]
MSNSIAKINNKKELLEVNKIVNSVKMFINSFLNQDLIAQAAERRLQNYEKRGLTPQSQVEFEQKRQKQEEAEQYKKEGRSQNCKWD